MGGVGLPCPPVSGGCPGRSVNLRRYSQSDLFVPLYDLVEYYLFAY